jgi:hypothetical protein
MSITFTQTRGNAPPATERLAQKPWSFDVMKDARAARSMYQRQLLRQFMTFLLSCLRFANRGSAPGRIERCAGIDRAFALSFFVVAVMLANAALAASDTRRTGWFTPACAAQDLRALATIEERAEVAGAPTEWLADAGLKHLQARILCLSGQEGEGVALYQSIIGSAAPVLNASKTIERVRP